MEKAGSEAWGAPHAKGEFLYRTVAEMRRDGLIYAIIIAHALAALVMAIALGDLGKLAFLASAPVWIRGVLLVVLACIVLVELPPSIRADRARPLARLRGRLWHIFNPRVAAGLTLMAAIILFNGAFTSVKTMLGDLTTFGWDRPLADLTVWMGGGVDTWAIWQPLIGHHAVTRFLQYLYTGGWSIALCTLPAVMALCRGAAFLRNRFFLTYLFCWIGLGNVMAGLFMSAGPVYYGAVTGDHARFEGLLQYLSFSQGLAYSSPDLQQSLWSLHQSGRADLGTGISAFPSLHVAMATLFALTLWRLDRRLGWAGIVFLILILVGSVHLAWHYAIDGYVSMLATVGFWYGVAWFERPHLAIAARLAIPRPAAGVVGAA